MHSPEMCILNIIWRVPLANETFDFQAQHQATQFSTLCVSAVVKAPHLLYKWDLISPASL